MTYARAWDGVYLLKQISAGKGVDHYGVGVAGNWVLRLHRTNAVVVHLTPSSLRIDRWDKATWNVLERSPDPGRALDRMARALRNKAWDLIGNNCEQFAREIVTGKRESRQLQGAVVIAGLAALTALALNSKG